MLMNEQNKPLIIFDTDMDTDCDDVGALAMLLNAHLSKKAELLGIITDSVCKYAAPFCETMTRFYEVSLPIGAIYERDYQDTDSNIKRFENYRKHSDYCFKQQGYNYVLSKEIQKNDIDYPPAVKMYRELLANARDRSVTVLCVGLLTSVAEALSSPPDSISPLSGVELFRQKVYRVITMGNPEKINDFNWGMDAYAAKRFFDLCPVPVYISPEGADIITGAHLSRLHSQHPLRRAYELWLGKEGCGRASWDLIASLFAINPSCPHLTQRDLGTCRYSSTEKKLYECDSLKGQFKLLSTSCEPSLMANLLNEYMLGNFDLQ